MKRFSSSLGEYTLSRYPKTQDNTLQAWDAADEYLLNEISQQQWHQDKNHILVVNDSFGALSVILSQYTQVTHWHDSLLAQIACQKNAQHNNTEHPLQYCASTEIPAPDIDLVIIKPPKNLRLLKHQLQILNQHFANIPVVIGMMQKHITSGLKSLVEHFIDNPEPSRAVKKARLVSGQLLNHAIYEDDYHYFEVDDLIIANQPNVFSSESLDIGSRFLLEHFPDLAHCKQVFDLGCGNGVLSAVAAYKNPNVAVLGVDESYMAVASAQQTFLMNQLNTGTFRVNNALSNIEQKADAILCNPPFHQQRQVSTGIAHQMIRQSKQCLTQGGQLWIVANRHLGYHTLMKKTFGNLEVAQANSKFVILQSIHH
ncbi:methyltransferase [Pleionea sp. CnH1-48]|uniref:methyltransferase n=1 Tax=Pleionea sp. CnH1-48 TaxID=2954494 RepID=UPI00209820AF|nr:methyltransferase [Pleionea sp. CnH1-48]MCO7226814.1 methyltransferase [Pleionea sp. CnH1-48]